VFFLPFIALIGFSIWKTRPVLPITPSWVFALTGAVMTFGVSSMFWDILNVPALGAYSWFVLGALGSPRRATSDRSGVHPCPIDSRDAAAIIF
jgi:hypothetical protein